MKLIALLSGENIDLSKAEFLANLEKQGIKYQSIKTRDRLLFIETNKVASFDHLALTHEVCEFLGDFSDAEKINWRKIFGKAAAVRGIKIPPALDVSRTAAEKAIGEIFWKNKIKVDFASKKIARIYLIENGDFLARIIWQNKEDFQGRRAHLRPFVSPISLHPKFARAIINLARIKKGYKILDPFCGTGGILIEAGLVGARVSGTDIDSRLVAGCKKNLEHFGISAKNIKKGDALETKGKFDAVITELPFGRSTHLTMPKKALYKKFIALLPQLLEKGGFAVVSCDVKNLPRPKKLKLIDGPFELYVHGTTTRRFRVFKKK